MILQKSGINKIFSISNIKSSKLILCNTKLNDDNLILPFLFPLKIKNSLLTVVTESFKYPRRDLNPYILADTGF